MSDSDSSDEDEFKFLVLATYCFQRRLLRKSISLPAPRIRRSDGRSYVKQLLDNPPKLFHKVYRMNSTTFLNLCDMLKSKGLLKDTKYVCVEEQLAIFLGTVGQNQRYCTTRQLFRRSVWTISHYFNKVLDAIVTLEGDYLCYPSSVVAKKIRQEDQFYPYFKDCIGAIDGTYIPALVTGPDMTRFRNRQGVLCQNVIAACSFDMLFIYVLAGFEGSATDASVLRSALSREDRLLVPDGKYYLVVAGYANLPGFLAPYQGTRYHLKEFEGESNQPQNPKELFNHRHSSLRNIIKTMFGMLKTRFAVLQNAPPYPYATQVKLVVACCILHNYIRLHDKKDKVAPLEEERPVRSTVDEDDTYYVPPPELRGNDMSMNELRHRAGHFRDVTAEAMWENR